MLRGLRKLWGGAQGICAVALALLIVLPSFDFACAAEGLSAPVAVHAATAAPSKSTHAVPAEGLACAHGHCHHNVIADLTVSAPIAASAAVRLVHVPAAFSSPDPIWGATLERPPRV